ncbi:DoxX family protein [Burkholderia sp. PU8-34]
MNIEQYKDGILLVVRFLLMILFVLFGWQKAVGLPETVQYMASTGVPLPPLFAVVAVLGELFGGVLIVLGFYTRPVAFIFAVYVLLAALIGHRYWSLTGMARYMAMVNFYKNLSISGGMMLLVVIGPGKFSLDKE